MSFTIHKRLEQNRQMLSSLYAAAGLGAQALTGTPHTQGVSDAVSDLIIEIEDLEQSILALEIECDREKQKIRAYISNIHDDQTRLIFRLRFIHCMTWFQAAEAIAKTQRTT